MKKTLTLLVAAIIGFGMNVFAVDITVVDKVKPTDEMFMDMAVTAAKKSVASKNPAAGAVIILNGAWRATGVPEGGKTAEEVAVSKSRLSTLKHSTIYTVNEPTAAVINMLNSMGVDAIYFANPRDAVIAAGIYPASAYDDESIEVSEYQAPVYQMPVSDAASLLKK